jgi:nitric oxide reductase NorE protein
VTSLLSSSSKDDQSSPSPVPHVPGEVGIWVLIGGDLLIFAALFATYLNYRLKSPRLFGSSQLELNQAYGVANTLLLVLSSLFVATAVRAVRTRGRGVAPWLLVGAIACGLGFSLLKALEYHGKVEHHITPSTNRFFQMYFVLTGLHWFHVLIGMIVLCVLFRMSGKETLTKKQLIFFEGGACFWHMVDMLWIVLFPLLYLVR